MTVDDDLLFPGLKLEDLVGEGESSDEESEEESTSNETSPSRETSDQRRELAAMISYHTAAVK